MQKELVDWSDGLDDWTTGLTFLHRKSTKCNAVDFYVQWNLSIADTLGRAEGVLIREVSSFQG